MNILIDAISLNPDQDDNCIADILSRQYGLDSAPFRIERKSLDARNTDNIVYRYRIVVTVSDEDGNRLLGKPGVIKYPKIESKSNIAKATHLHGIIVGCGPAGLFCAMRIIESGGTVDIIERGKKIDDRLKDIKELEENGRLDEESNVLFGEGGAGAYSDGKLNTRIHKPETEYVFRQLIRFGAPDSIAFESRPHLGSDAIRGIVQRIRDFILRSGSRIHFQEKMVDFIRENRRVKGVTTASGMNYTGTHVILAIGHSSRDTYEMLDKNGIVMEKKGFAVGVRIEHPKDYINSLVYRESKYRSVLPAAYYSMTYKNRKTRRGTYTFCMCPGGHVINSSSEQGSLCTNGMSFSDRGSDFSNAAVVVTAGPEDLPDGVLGGIEFQRRIEREAYNLGGGGFYSPLQTLPDFLENTVSVSDISCSYKPGITPADLHRCIPRWVCEEITGALYRFNEIYNGFITEHGVCVGVETRTSAPVRIVRNEHFESLSHRGLYPIGEGAGYAGGIISSAVDGVKTADAIIQAF